MAEFMAIEVAEYIERGLDTRTKGGLRVVETPCTFLDLDGWLQVSNSSPAGKFEATADCSGLNRLGEVGRTESPDRRSGGRRAIFGARIRRDLPP